MAKTKRRWHRDRADTKGEAAQPPMVEMAKKELAETVLENSTGRMAAALGGFAPTLTTDDIKDDVKSAEKAQKEAEGKSVDPDAPDAMAQTSQAHRAALGGLAFSEGFEGVALPKAEKAKASAKD
jgi:hypothetical protein